MQKNQHVPPLPEVDRGCTCWKMLPNDWYNKKGTAIYAFMVALGFEHDNYRKDRIGILKINKPEDYQYSNKANLAQEITTFDPLSIMMYREYDMLVKSRPYKIWKLK